MPPNPCSGDCYLIRRGNQSACFRASLSCIILLADALNASSSKRRSNGLVVDVSSNGRNKSVVTDWSPHEESLMELMRSVGIQDCCIIARSLFHESDSRQKRTCNDVYQYFSRQGPLSPKVNVLREMPIK